MRFRPPTLGLRWYFDHNDGRLIHKWLHYFPIYERHFDGFRSQRVAMLEIGVSQGGSLQMWRHYFGRRSTIVGVDIEPRVADLAEDRIIVEVGDQSDPVFMASLANRHGPFDIVLDDGSHQPAHQIASAEILWSSVNEGGVYMVEDVQTNYLVEYDGGPGRDDTFIAWIAKRIDDMHAFHSRTPGFAENEWTRTLSGVHVYDGIVVLEKAARSRPEHRKTGRPSFDDVYGTESEDMIDAAHRKQLESLNTPRARARRLLRDPVGTVRRFSRRFSR